MVPHNRFLIASETEPSTLYGLLGGLQLDRAGNACFSNEVALKLATWDPDIRSLVDRIQRGDVDLQPDFQRGEVWSISKKRRLIDTILREWSMPPVHFIETKDQRLEVLDGQQRLSSIRDFVLNGFSVDGRISPVDENLIDLHGRFYEELPPNFKRKINNYTVRAFRITDFQPEEPSELFYRLNQPTSLTAGEQRNALFGPSRYQLKLLVSSFVEFDNNVETIGFSNSRMSYDDVFAKLLFFLEQKTFAVKGTESKISDRFKEPGGFSEEVVDRARFCAQLFSKARSHLAERFRFNKASLLSWLLFYARWTDNSQQHIDAALYFLRYFSISFLSRENDRHIVKLIDVFQDRSSLRVSDVTSVVYRDVVLWAVFKDFSPNALPRYIDGSTLDRILSRMKSERSLPVTALLDEEIDTIMWGHSL